ncbi:hypothetical protein D3C81_2237240 [compost metagenome]
MVVMAPASHLTVHIVDLGNMLAHQVMLVGGNAHVNQTADIYPDQKEHTRCRRQSGQNHTGNRQNPH